MTYEVDFSIYKEAPLFFRNNLVQASVLDPNSFKLNVMNLRQNDYETKDDIVNLVWPSFEGTFYTLGEFISMSYPLWSVHPYKVMELVIGLDPYVTTHQR